MLLLTGCTSEQPASASDDTAAIVNALGAQDGYLFVLNPFNCLLRERQIDQINRLAARSRRGARLLMAGTEPADSVAGVRALDQLGLHLPALTLSGSPVARTTLLHSLGWPLVIAVRNGQIIGTLAGSTTQRLASWIPWLEYESVARPAVSPQPGEAP